MRCPIPVHAERISLGGEAAWAWKTEHRWSVLQWPYRVDLSNWERVGEARHMIDWLNDSPRKGEMEGGLARSEAGHLGRDEFLVIAEEIVLALRKGNASPVVPG